MICNHYFLEISGSPVPSDASQVHWIEHKGSNVDESDPEFVAMRVSLYNAIKIELQRQHRAGGTKYTIHMGFSPAETK